MKQDFTKYIYTFFNPLIEKYGFNIKNELYDEQSYSIEYSSKTIEIKLEKYRQEFYVTLYVLNHPDKEISIFNLLDYLNQTSDSPKAEYFRDEKDIDECYRKQLNYISTVIYNYYEVMNDFMNSSNYTAKVADLEKFMAKKHPDLFRTELLPLPGASM